MNRRRWLLGLLGMAAVGVVAPLSGTIAKFVASPGQREIVQVLTAVGWSHEEIATHLEIDLSTLRSAFANELKAGSVAVRAKIIRAIYSAAIAGSVPAIKVFLSATDRRVMPPHFGEERFRAIAAEIISEATPKIVSAAAAAS